MNDLNDSMERYLKICKLERRLDIKTLKAYRCDLKQFIAWLHSNERPFDRASVGNYISLLNSDFAPRSVKRKIASVRAFANYLETREFGYSNPNPFSGQRISIREPRLLPKTIPLSYMNEMFESVYDEAGCGKSSASTSNTSIRDKAIFEILIATGIRVSELCGLNESDLDCAGKLLKVFGKGSKERTVQIENNSTIAAIFEYLKSLKEQKTNFHLFGRHYNQDALFLNRLGNRLSEQSVRAIIMRVAKTAGITERITPHMFRHTFATLLLEKDVDIRFIQKLLGHSSIKTTEIYTYVSSAKLREILKTKNPRDEIAVVG